MALGTEGGLGPSDIVLDGDPALPHGKGHRSFSLFGPLCSGTVAHLNNCWAVVAFSQRYCGNTASSWILRAIISWSLWNTTSLRKHYTQVAIVILD